MNESRNQSTGYHDISLRELDSCVDYWRSECQGCAEKAMEAAAAVRKYGTIAIRIMCFADCEEDLEKSIQAIDPESVVGCVDGDMIIVLSHEQARLDFLAWCGRNVSYDC